MRDTWIDRLRRDEAATAAFAVFVLSAATILGAWYFQLVVKLPPCPLCLEERIPYYIVIPLSLLTAVAALVHAPRQLIAVGFLGDHRRDALRRRARRLSRRCGMALLAGPDRLLGPDDRFHQARIAA